jgi:hypothetical protein
MDNKSERNELKRPVEAMKDLEPDEHETEQVKGGSFSWGPTQVEYKEQ